MKTNFLKRSFSAFMAVLMVLSCWVWFEPAQMMADAAASTLKDHYLFAYFTGTSKEGQTIHLAVSTDGYNYTALRNNEPVIIPSKGVGNVRDPYIWYNEQDNYYYILATDLDFTDGGGTYSNNSQSFIIWRSKDLVNWYDETFIDVSKMAHLIGDTRNMSAVWAPQVLWDGSAYVVYFTLACNATSWFDIVYLKTTDLMNPDAYYEFDYILGNGTGNGTDNGYGVIDADIIHNPGDGKYYLFYKTECNANELGTTNKGTSLKTIHYYVGDTPTGPFTNPGDTKWPNCGFSVFPNYNVSLEGCNSFFDNDGNLIMYVDEFEHTNALGEAEAYFHIAKSNGYDFTSWSYPDVSQHNINSLSPRHGSVVKITEAEYTRLLNNSYNITSSSYPETEVLEDHLVAKYFTTADVLWNAVVGQPNLASSTGITMVDDPSIGYYADFDSESGGWAEVDFDSLFLKTNGLNYEDGFTITFSAMLQPNESVNNENNDRIYEIADVFGSRTGTEHYTHFSPGGGGNGSYLGNYNGPADSGNDWLNDKDRANRDDECFHEYIISYATGNVMVYVDGELVISRNRFTGVKLDDSWYKALGSNATMRIGRSGWDADPLFKGRIQNLCIYDCSMSYYDAQSMNDDYKENLGWVSENTYTGITSVVPTFQNTDAARMQSLPNASQHFSNILYTSNTVKNYEGNNMSSDSAVCKKISDLWVAMYYPETTVLLLDGINDAIMPVSFGYYCETKNRSQKGFYNVYPTSGPGSTADLGELEISQNWAGWYRNGDYYECIVSHADGYIGRNSTTTSWSELGVNDANRNAHYAAPLKVNEDKIDFGNSYYKKFNLTWQINGNYKQSGSEASTHTANITSANDIYVIDFRPILELRSQITEAAYNEVMNNSELCAELRQKYAAAVYTIRTLDPTNFGFAASPVTATKACGKAIGEAIGTYEGVMAEIAREKASGNYGHQPSEFEAREATCAVAGLTAGSYCVICGEILEKQEVIAPLAHTFGAIFTENGVQYKECSVCGVRIEYQASGVRYENLFSLNGWMDSLSYNNGNGVSGGATLSADSANGTITINNSNTGEAVTSTSGGTNRDGTWDCYCIPVKGNRTYVVEFTVSGVEGEIHIFKYDINGNLTGSYGDTPVAGTNGTFSKEFTVNATTAYIELRFDCNAKGKAIFSQIGVYSKESFDTFAVTTADARLGFYPGNDKVLCYPNPAPGYTFDGWYTKSGMKVDNVYQLNNPTTIVYGKWIKAGYNVVYDSIFSFSDWAKSSCNQLWYGDIYQLNDDGSRGAHSERLVSKEGILADAENGTITITWDADNKNYSDTANKLFYQYCARTNLHFDNGNLYKIPVEKNTEYIIEYTSASNDGGKPNVCAYMPTNGTDENGKNMAAQESGSITKYALGTQYFRINTCASEELTLRFDNVQIGSTLTYSNIAVYKADVFLDHAKNITNREYRRYYPTEMGIGDVFEYIPERPGYVFETWMADTDGDMVGDFNMKGFDDAFVVDQNWHLFSVWKEKERVNVTFDNLIDFKAWNKSAGNGTVSDVTDTGFTITSNDGAGESTSSSPFFTVEPGKQYKIDIDFVGNNWDVYIFFCNASGGLVDFADGPTNRYSSNGSTGITADNAIFTAPNKSEVVKAQIRVDSNGSNNTVNFDNIRVYEYNGNNIDVSPVNKYVAVDETFGTLPTPKRTGYNFLGWYDANGNKYTEASVMTGNTTVNLHSEWEITSDVLVSDAYVLDFGMKAVFTPLENDTILKNDGTPYSISGVSIDGKTAGSSVKGSYGTFTVNGTAVEYVPTAVMNGKEIAYYHVTVGDKVLVGSITVFPATVVYYEDDVTSAVKYTDGVAKTPDSGFENSGK
ncbi:MAG: InlB B-repeat-containing protein, partial [Clostridia bacterium]|nr:InlB B-repeat-containing protein [Clostridia bacterium]